jgi:Chlorophyll A-B binding protein
MQLIHSATLAMRAPVITMQAPAAATDFCYGLPGNIAPAGDFDPAGFCAGKSKNEVYRFREAELTHGRVGMLAAAGFLVQEFFHPLFSGDNGPAIEQIPQLPPPLWFGMTLAIGVCESLRIQKGWANPYEGKDISGNLLKEDYYPGDLAWDPLGLKPTDPAEFKLMQERELSHGRLGMLAAAGFIAQEAVTGTTWASTDSTEEGILLGGWFAQRAADLAQ